jgi:hypothetical protein
VAVTFYYDQLHLRADLHAVLLSKRRLARVCNPTDLDLPKSDFKDPLTSSRAG